MNNLPAVRWLLRILINPGWAPLGVVGLHLTMATQGLTERFDHLLHFLGGAAIAYFCWGLLALAPVRCAGIPLWCRFTLAFTSTCTVALFWEFAEFASDQFWGTATQRGLSETVFDLAFGVVGAMAALLVVAMSRGIGRRFKTGRRN